MVSKLLVALIVIRNSAFFDRNFWNWKTWRHKHKHYFWFTMSLHEHMWRQKSMESRLLIALIVIRNSAFYCDRNFWNLKTWRHKKYGVKTFDCSHCDKKFGLFCVRNVWNWRHEDTESMVSKLFIALIVIRNSAFYFVTGISEICRHEDTKNMVSKLFIALIVINISAFFDNSRATTGLDQWDYNR